MMTLLYTDPALGKAADDLNDALTLAEAAFSGRFRVVSGSEETGCHTLAYKPGGLWINGKPWAEVSLVERLEAAHAVGRLWVHLEAIEVTLIDNLSAVAQGVTDFIENTQAAEARKARSGK